MTPRLKAALNAWFDYYSSKYPTLANQDMSLIDAIEAENAPRESVVITFQMILKNPLNGRQHWRTVSARNRTQKAATLGHCLVALAKRPEIKQWPAFDIKLTRIAPKRFDSDNLGAALKIHRDAVAFALGFKDDSDPRLSWEYDQTRGGVKENLVRIEITKREA